MKVTFDRSDMEKYRAAVVSAAPATAAEMENLVQQLDLFDFIPGISTPEEYGRHMIRESGHFAYDENLEDYYNFERYGADRIKQEHGKFCDNGYISYHGFVSMEELLAGVECGRMEMTMG